MANAIRLMIKNKISRKALAAVNTDLISSYYYSLSFKLCKAKKIAERLNLVKGVIRDGYIEFILHRHHQLNKFKRIYIEILERSLSGNLIGRGAKQV